MSHSIYNNLGYSTEDMGFVRLTLIDQDENYVELSKTYPLKLINEIDLLDQTVRTSFTTGLYATIREEGIASAPTCACGALHGRINLGRKHDVPECGTFVAEHEDFIPLFWLKAPEGIDYLINPQYLIVLQHRFKIATFNTIAWLIDPFYPVPKNKRDVADELKHLGFKRGYNNFVRDFDNIMNRLLSIPRWREGNPPLNAEEQMVRLNRQYSLDDDIEFLRKYRHLAFQTYQPLPSQSLMLREVSELGNFVAKSMLLAVEVATSLAGIDLSNKSVQQKERMVAKALLTFCSITVQSYVLENYRFLHQGKYGDIRRHMLGTKTLFTSRLVWSLITSPSEFDEVHLPWVAAMEIFQHHITSKLLQRGFSYGEAWQILEEGNYAVTPLLEEIINELFMESRGAFECLHVRNPSLEQLSVQLLRVTHIKRDITDMTVSTTYAVMKGFNADVDGDTGTTTIVFRRELVEMLRPLQPEFGMYRQDEPGKISAYVHQPSTAITLGMGYLDDMEFTYEPAPDVRAIQFAFG